jgi:3-oxoacyl-[acyl-carrier protein] reductase
MSKMLKNQVAIVTGSARGIGREDAQMFVDHGAKVVITDKDEALLQKRLQPSGKQVVKPFLSAEM